MRDRTLVTGFLPFNTFAVNPSALLAEACGQRFELLEVSYEAADRFLDRIRGRARDTFDRLLMLGLRGGGTTIELERYARNHVGPEADVRGAIRGPGPVEPGAPDVLPSMLFDGRTFPSVSASDDAGCYLCNYVYYRALRLLPEKRVGFVHVPRLEVLALTVQQARIARLIQAVEGRSGAMPA